MSVTFTTMHMNKYASLEEIPLLCVVVLNNYIIIISIIFLRWQGVVNFNRSVAYRNLRFPDYHQES